MCQHDPTYQKENESNGGNGCPRCNSQRWSTDEQRAEWKDNGAEKIAQLADEKQDEWLTHIADQFEDWLDFNRLCGDLAL